MVHALRNSRGFRKFVVSTRRSWFVVNNGPSGSVRTAQHIPQPLRRFRAGRPHAHGVGIVGGVILKDISELAVIATILPGIALLLVGIRF
jgi:hypothetical protein